jgi:hypothetical protein
VLRNRARATFRVVAILAVLQCVSSGTRPALAERPRPTASPAGTPIPLFQPILAALHAGTRVPILLPTWVPQFPVSGTTLTAILIHVSSRGYEIHLNVAIAGCPSEGCFAGLIDSDPAIGPIDTSVLSSSQRVTLSNGLHGYVGEPLGAPAVIIWDRRGRRYTMAFPVVNVPQDLLTMANSMTAY